MKASFVNLHFAEILPGRYWDVTAYYQEILKCGRQNCLITFIIKQNCLIIHLHSVL